jgi:hypothetical protein
VKFSDGSAAGIYVGEQENLDEIMVNHCSGKAFFHALYLLADQIKGCIYWPDIGPCCLVTDAATLPHLPVEFAEGLGPPSVVSDGAGIMDALGRL